MGETKQLKDEDIKTTWTRGGGSGQTMQADPDTTDPDTSDADGTDSDTGTDADTTDADSDTKDS